MEEQRTIYNNPSGKPFCCHLTCNADATWHIQYSNTAEDYTHSCDDHFKDMNKEGATAVAIES